MKNIFKSIFNSKKKIKPLSEEGLKENINNLKINGFKLPKGIIDRIENDEWMIPKDLKHLKELVLDQSPFEYGTKSLDQMINDFTLYPLRTMKNESERLINWLHPKWDKSRTMFLGNKDDEVYPGNIEPTEVILFADFGLGSDTAFGLDYRVDKNNPIVILEYWGENPETDNRWKKIADSFNEFEKMIWK